MLIYKCICFPFRSWKVKQAEDIAKREEESSRKKEETIVKAQNAIDNFYKEYNSKKEKNIAINKYVFFLILLISLLTL